MEKKKINVGAVGIVVGLSVIILFFVIALPSSPFKSPSNLLNKIDAAQEFAKKTVTLYLKSPASAQFSDVASFKGALDADPFFIFGDVDSQNSFGALLRNHFAVELIYGGNSVEDNQNWKVQDLTIGSTNFIFEGKVRDEPLELSQTNIAEMSKLEDIFRNPAKYVNATSQ